MSVSSISRATEAPAWLWNGEEPRITSVFQPIVDLMSGEPIGYEVLSRGVGPPQQAAPVIFNKARVEGVTWELERACWTAAVRRIAHLPSESRRVPFFFNVGPEVLSDPRFHDGSTLELLARNGMSPQQIVLEITETSTFTDSEELQRIARQCTGHGFGLALDDFGAGHSGLVTLVHSAPRFIKLDQALVRDLHRHVYKQQLLKALADFAARVDSILIAEGVETWDELDVVLGLGIRHAQGYLLARPASHPGLPSEEFELRRREAIRELPVRATPGVRTGPGPMPSPTPSPAPPRRFHAEPLVLIHRHLREALGAGRACIEVPDPDLGRGLYAGERVGPGGELVHRPLRSWCDLAEGLSCRLLTPRAVDETHVALTFEPLGPEAPWHAGGAEAPEATAPHERYGAGSAFARLRKLEDAGFLLPWLEALGRVSLGAGARVLDLGVNRGDELAAFAWLEGSPEVTFVGVDHSASALAEARARFPDAHHEFVLADLNALPAGLGRFSLVVSVGTLQSPGVDDHALLRRLVQEHLEPRAALVLGFPNSRFRDGEVVYGARVRNLREPDLSLLVKDLSFYRRYLHQHGFRTFLSGKYDLLLTAVRGEP